MPKEIRKCCYKDVFLKRKSIICPVVLKGKKEADKGILRQKPYPEFYAIIFKRGQEEVKVHFLDYKTITKDNTYNILIYVSKGILL